MKSYICDKYYKMNKHIFYLLLSISVLFTSCIPTQDLIYLQKKDNSETEMAISAIVAKPIDCKLTTC
jgi:polysaccharide export outer membrane protein